MRDSFSKVSLFEGLGPAELDGLVAVSVERRYPRHAVIVTEGDRSDAMYVILEGQVRVYVSTADDREYVLGTQGPGTCFGEMVLDDGPRSASVQAVSACRLAMLTRESFRSHLRSHPDLSLALIGNLIRRCRTLTENAKDLALLDVYGRLAKLLLGLAVTDETGRLVIAEPLTQQEMANRIGASREMVSRIWRDLVAGGYVASEAGRVVIQRKPPARW
jgi:CRP/FNR family cyclic AMP-dependent transcriptional regulator